MYTVAVYETPQFRKIMVKSFQEWNDVNVDKEIENIDKIQLEDDYASINSKLLRAENLKIENYLKTLENEYKKQSTKAKLNMVLKKKAPSEEFIKLETKYYHLKALDDLRSDTNSNLESFKQTLSPFQSILSHKITKNDDEETSTAILLINQVRRKIAACLLQEGYKAKALDLYRDVLLQHEENLLTWIDRGNQFCDIGVPLMGYLHSTQVLIKNEKHYGALKLKQRAISMIHENQSECQVPFTVKTSITPKLILQRKRAADATMVEGMYSNAATMYQRIIDMLPTSNGTALNTIYQKIRYACHINIVSCCLERSMSSPEVLKHCDTALSLKMDNDFVLLRKGQLHLLAHEYQDAQKAFNSIQAPTAFVAKCIDRCQYQRSLHDINYIDALTT